MKLNPGKIVLVTLLSAAAAYAQGKRPSPPEETSISLGGHSITIKYSAPYAKGRKIWGGLVPYGREWRLGANEATSLSTSADLEIGSLHVPAGNYTLYMFPEEGQSLLIVNKQTGQWGTEYDQSRDLGRVKLTRSAIAQHVEQLSLQLKSAPGGAASLEITWEKAKFSVPVRLAK